MVIRRDSREESGVEWFGQTELPHDGVLWHFEGAHRGVWGGTRGPAQRRLTERGATSPGAAVCCL